MSSNKQKSNGSRLKSNMETNLNEYNSPSSCDKQSFRSSSLVVDNSSQKAGRSCTTASIHKMNSTNQSKSTSTKTKSIAKLRWNILKQAILSKNSSLQVSKSSVRRFSAFGFIKCVKIAYTPNTTNKSNGTSKYYKDSNYTDNADADDDDDDICYQISKTSINPQQNKHRMINNSKSQTNFSSYDWFHISVPSLLASNSFVKARFYNGAVGLKDLAGFNNTGNICIWPSEEIMTYFCVKNMQIFENKSVCELGGGMTCLAGLMISKFSEPGEVFLTDGNETSFENLEVICSENEFRCSVECCLLKWSKETHYGDLEGRFDYIICADCLFFDSVREDLCATIYKLLKMDGTCLIFAPNRQNTFHKFVDMAKIHFECMIVHDYDMEIWEKHLYEKENNADYDEDLHYPLLLKLKKRTRANNDFCKMVL